MYNQDIKPLLPSLSYPYQKSILPVKTQPQQVLQSTGLSNNLPPLQFYSSKDAWDEQGPQIPNQMSVAQMQMNQMQMNQMQMNQMQMNMVPMPSQGLNIPGHNIHDNQTVLMNQNYDMQYAYMDKEDDKYSIDYSSIINYTNSPSLKRKRRSKSATNVSEDQTKLPCQVCGKIFAKPYNLKSHMKSHSKEKPFKCSYCPKTFARSHDKKRHELLHNGEKNFKCEGFLKDGKTKWGCGKKFARSDALSRHFRTETGWLCIKPLMDEAKALESNDLINNYTHS
ncbi:hypothetical protein CLIB1444_04S03026 [[Candida] jaroonii]|uniref:Uncharacterized protein n=1 Tax=[Candida] jaroonii TaxID=467808 RepID=A0ACA9Y6B6_9ASCO|nr:hypothetical protein CLIB1444_04S03026 [[Candida] jaroonii]